MFDQPAHWARVRSSREDATPRGAADARCRGESKHEKVREPPWKVGQVWGRSRIGLQLHVELLDGVYGGDELRENVRRGRGNVGRGTCIHELLQRRDETARLGSQSVQRAAKCACGAAS